MKDRDSRTAYGYDSPVCFQSTSHRLRRTAKFLQHAFQTQAERIYSLGPRLLVELNKSPSYGQGDESYEAEARVESSGPLVRDSRRTVTYSE